MTPLPPEALLELVPHRAPFLFLDHCELDLDGERILASWTPAENWEPFQGHFPDLPVVPGVILVEMLAQAACALGRSIAPETRDKPVFLVGLDDVRFRRPVRPGERVEAEVRFRKRRRGLWRFDGVARTGGEVAVEAELLATLGEQDA